MSGEDNAHTLAYRVRRNRVYIPAIVPRNGLPGPQPYVWRDPGRKATVEAILAAIREDADAEKLLADAWDEPYAAGGTRDFRGSGLRAFLLRPCGTPAAYRRHLRHGQKPCQACTDAQRRSHAARKEAS